MKKMFVIMNNAELSGFSRALIFSTPVVVLFRREGERTRQQEIYVHAMEQNRSIGHIEVEISFPASFPDSHNLYKFMFNHTDVEFEVTKALPEEDEEHFLRWFYKEAFPRSDREMYEVMKKQYTEKTGKPVPEGY